MFYLKSEVRNKSEKRQMFKKRKTFHSQWAGIWWKLTHSIIFQKYKIDSKLTKHKFRHVFCKHCLAFTVDGSTYNVRYSPFSSHDLPLL